jgi:hypothetical protein
MLNFFCLSCFRCQKDYLTLWLAGHSCLRHYCLLIVREIDTKGLLMYYGAFKCSSQIVCFIELSCLTSLFYYLLPLVSNISKKLLSRFINYSMNLEVVFCLYLKPEGVHIFPAYQRGLSSINSLISTYFPLYMSVLSNSRYSGVIA